MRFKPEPRQPHGTTPRIGILLVNLGTPDDASAPAVRRYLKQFLSDPRIVEIPRLVWWFILNVIILNVRPKKTAAKYAGIWMKEGSPLRVHTERQAQLLRSYLGEHARSDGVDIPVVEVGMRYGNPSLAFAVENLKAAHCHNILVLPLYPQYAGSTTASTFDELGRVLALHRDVPGVRFVRSYHDHPAYVDAMAINVLAHWQKLGRPDFQHDKLLMTFHGVPRFHLDQGDPYHCQCHKTARLLGERLGLKPGEYLVTFQSRFGKAEWLQPYTDKTLESLGAAGTQRIDVICPGFAADCLETLEEIADEGRETFLHAGGKAFNYLPVANESEAYVKALHVIALDHLAGWLVKDDAEDRAAQVGLARNMGATN